MKKQFVLAFGLIALSSTHGHAAAELKGLHKAVQQKLDRYCPEALSLQDIEQLKEEKSLEWEGVTYTASDKKIGELTGTAAILCSGKYSQNRSNPGKVDCIFCNEDEAARKKELLTISTHVTRDVEETIAEREEELKEQELAKAAEQDQNLQSASKPNDQVENKA